MLNPVKERLRKHDCRASFFILRSSFLMTLASLLLTGCEHKELCYDHVHNVAVDVVFDWTNAPDARPAGMNLYFYPAEGGTPLRYGLPGREGGRIEIPDGTYHVVAVNNDSQTAQFRGTDAFETFEIYTRDASVLEGLGLMTTSRAPIVAGTEEQRVGLAPDLIYNGALKGQEIPYSLQPQTITLQPDEAVCNYTFEIIHVENLKYVSSLSGSLSGMSGSYLAGLDHCTTGLHTVPFEAEKTGETTIGGQFYVFGHCPEGNGDVSHLFALYVIQSDGSQVYYTFDVTEQVHNAPDPDNVHILIDGLTLPRPIENGGGMHPSVDDWENVEVDVSM